VDNLYRLVRDIPDFPKPGILFRDITPLLQDAAAFRTAVDGMAASFSGHRVTKVVAVESRGFVLGAPVALALGAGLVLVRKPGKLPAATRSASYALEYGTDTLEMHADALQPGDRVLVVDDVLATGGTAAAVFDLVGQAGARLVGLSLLIELADLGGRSRLGDRAPVVALLTYPRH